MKATTIARLAGLAALGSLSVLAPAAHAAAAPYPNGGNPQVLPRTQVSGETTQAQVAPASAAKASTLPFTGGDLAQLAALGVAGVGAGTFAVRRSRRRAG